jgi:hypothetical protein
MASFAEKQLQKYGWRQYFTILLSRFNNSINLYQLIRGQGIGKTSDGISRPIAAHYQQDTAGVSQVVRIY